MEVIKQQIVKEATHWYYRDGSPCYRVPLKKPVKEKDGSIRMDTDTTLRHGRELFLLTSTTTVTNLLINYGLQNWLINKAVLFGRNCPYPGTDEELLELWQTESSKAADRGTEIHEGIERTLFLGEKIEDPVVVTACEEISGMLKADGVQLLEHEHSVASTKRGRAGKLDAVVGVNGKVSGIRDWKTVEKPRPPYDKEIWQMCDYVRLLSERGEVVTDNKIVYIHQATGRILGTYVPTKEDYERSNKIMDLLMEVFVVVNNYDPRDK